MIADLIIAYYGLEIADYPKVLTSFRRGGVLMSYCPNVL